MQQAIIWTNDGFITDTYIRHLASMSWWYAIRKVHINSSNKYYSLTLLVQQTRYTSIVKPNYIPS